MNLDFYRAFEDRFRGSRDLIKKRLKVYFPFVHPLLSCYRNAAAIDLGCGRGEWLELLTEWGFHTLGVDQDEGMLQACHDLGLFVEHADALTYLTDLPSESQTVVSAFHVVEHISFDQLRTLVAEALRVLKPGGLLIMETPNPENMVVATRNFYLDPTHQRPIPSQLLSFVTEYVGFRRTKTLGLQEPEDLVQKAQTNLTDLFYGVSPDYAVVAQKNADEEVLAKFDVPFAQIYGLSLDDLLHRLDRRIQKHEAMSGQAEAKAEHAEAKAEQARSLAGQAEARAKQAEEAATQYLAQLRAIYASRSWRVTAPLRQGGGFARWFVRGSVAWLTFAPGSRPRRVIRTALIWAMKMVRSHPKLGGIALTLINKFPRLKQRLRIIVNSQTYADSHTCSPHFSPGADLSNLSPRARQIYLHIKTEIVKKKQEENFAHRH